MPKLKPRKPSPLNRLDVGIAITLVSGFWGLALVINALEPKPPEIELTPASVVQLYCEQAVRQSLSFPESMVIIPTGQTPKNITALTWEHTGQYTARTRAGEIQKAGFRCEFNDETKTATFTTYRL